MYAAADCMYVRGVHADFSFLPCATQLVCSRSVSALARRQLTDPAAVAERQPVVNRIATAHTHTHPSDRIGSVSVWRLWTVSIVSVDRAVSADRSIQFRKHMHMRFILAAARRYPLYCIFIYSLCARINRMKYILRLVAILVNTIC